jgi:hypothetical protein
VTVDASPPPPWRSTTANAGSTDTLGRVRRDRCSHQTFGFRSGRDGGDGPSARSASAGLVRAPGQRSAPRGWDAGPTVVSVREDGADGRWDGSSRSARSTKRDAPEGPRGRPGHRCVRIRRSRTGSVVRGTHPAFAEAHPDRGVRAGLDRSVSRPPRPPRPPHVPPRGSAPGARRPRSSPRRSCRGPRCPTAARRTIPAR